MLSHLRFWGQISGYLVAVIVQQLQVGVHWWERCKTCPPRGDVSNASKLSEAKKKLLTGCHKDHFNLQPRGSDYYGSGKNCMTQIKNDRVFNCLFCHRFHFVLNGKMKKIPELATRFGSEITEIDGGESLI